MLRTALLGGNSITLDADMSKYIETLSEQGVIEDLEVSSNSVAPGKAWVKATRSNGETIMVLVQNTEALSVDTSGTKKIWLEIKQEAIDNGALNNEDGTGIASIKTGSSVPSQNSLLLASVNNGRVEDARAMIPKIQSVAQRTTSLEQKMETQEQKVEKLEEAGTPSYLGITAIVGEKYTMEDTLFLQKTPSFADSTIAINVGDSAENKEQHIQRIASGTASNQLKLKMKKFGAPTTSVVIEVRKGVKVDVSNKEAYRYGGEVVASTTIAYTQFTTEWKEFTLTLNNQFGATKGELLDIVVYQQGGIVNGTNYYQIACDNTQYSEAFSVVAVNGSSRVRDKLMPYCVSEGFLVELLSRSKSETYNALSKAFVGGTGGNPNVTFQGQKILNKGDKYFLRLKNVGRGTGVNNGQYANFTFRINLSDASNEIRKTVGVRDRDVPISPTENYNYLFFYASYYSQVTSADFEILKLEKAIGPSTFGIKAKPQEQIAIGRKAEVTIFGLDSNREWYYDLGRLHINKTLTGNASSSINVPRRGFLQVYCNVVGGTGGDEGGMCKINNREILRYKRADGWQNLSAEVLVYVEAGEIILHTWNNSGSATMTILSFIPL